MQTFLPYPSFQDSMRALDPARLGCQRKEAGQILQILLGLPSASGKPIQAYAHHPIVRGWCGYELSLSAYGMTACMEFSDRGYQDNMYPIFATLALFLSGAPVRTVLGLIDDWPASTAESRIGTSLVAWMQLTSDDRIAVRYVNPPWLGDPAIHASHRGILYHKKPTYYAAQWPDRGNAYVWPNIPADRDVLAMRARWQVRHVLTG